MSDSPRTDNWRQDFPIEWGADHYITRREFTKFLVLISGATFLGNGYFVLNRPAPPEGLPRVRVAGIEELPVGGVRLFRYPTDNDPAILLRLGDGQYAAYLQRCTHLTCPVHFQAARNRLECPCHNGAFEAATGRVLEGPPPRPLPKIKLAIENGEIFAAGLESGEEREA